MPVERAHQKQKMTPCQEAAWNALCGTKNIFLTGAAGTGKSFMISEFLRKKSTRQYPVVASTGAAAIIIDGRTFHSFFGIGIMQGTIDEIVTQALRSSQVKRRLNEAECVVIDEVSMLSGATLDAASEVAKAARKSLEPWGGLRIVAVGDFAQLPPVSEAMAEKDWAFLHPVWEETDFTTVHLRTVVRTDEERLLRILHLVRTGQLTDEVRDFFDAKAFDADYEFDGTRLFAHRRSADAHNQARLKNLSAREHVFTTQFQGDAASVEKLRRNLPIPEELHLKRDALVMIRKNDTKFPYRYINGTLATVMEVDEDSILLRLLNGKDIEIERQKFSLLDGNGAEKAFAYNFPLTLAWATTIHKAQGATIDRVMVDLSQLWESGHAYVALSRVPSEDGLYIEKWSERSVRIDPEVQRFYAELES